MSQENPAVLLRPLRTPINRHILGVTRANGYRSPAVGVVLDEIAAAGANASAFV